MRRPWVSFPQIAEAPEASLTARWASAGNRTGGAATMEVMDADKLPPDSDGLMCNSGSFWPEALLSVAGGGTRRVHIIAAL